MLFWMYHRQWIQNKNCGFRLRQATGRPPRRRDSSGHSCLCGTGDPAEGEIWESLRYLECWSYFLYHALWVPSVSGGKSAASIPSDYRGRFRFPRISVVKSIASRRQFHRSNANSWRGETLDCYTPTSASMDTDPWTCWGWTMRRSL